MRLQELTFAAFSCVQRQTAEQAQIAAAEAGRVRMCDKKLRTTESNENRKWKSRVGTAVADRMVAACGGPDNAHYAENMVALGVS